MAQTRLKKREAVTLLRQPQHRPSQQNQRDLRYPQNLPMPKQHNERISHFDFLGSEREETTNRRCLCLQKGHQLEGSKSVNLLCRGKRLRTTARR